VSTVEHYAYIAQLLNRACPALHATPELTYTFVNLMCRNVHDVDAFAMATGLLPNACKDILLLLTGIGTGLEAAAGSLFDQPVAAAAKGN
jgi:hypothetical protein